MSTPGNGSSSDGTAPARRGDPVPAFLGTVDDAGQADATRVRIVGAADRRRVLVLVRADATAALANARPGARCALTTRDPQTLAPRSAQAQVVAARPIGAAGRVRLELLLDEPVDWFDAAFAPAPEGPVAPVPPVPAPARARPEAPPAEPAAPEPLRSERPRPQPDEGTRRAVTPVVPAVTVGVPDAGLAPPRSEPATPRRYGVRMKIARVVGAVGRTMVTLGVLTLLFVAFQLWGTSLQEARAQDKLDGQFAALLSTTTTTTTPTVSAPATTTPAAPTTTAAPVPPSLPDFDLGDAVARIQIPKIGVDKIVVEGVSTDDLRKGPGHYRSTPMPGQEGNAAIAGHRTTYGAPFNRIDELEPGDEIVVTTPQGRFTYRVFDDVGDLTGHRIVKPTDTWVLNDFGDNRLTLTACHPKRSAAQRIVVVARLVETPAVATPAPAPATATPTTTLPGDPATSPATSTAATPPADEIGLGWNLDEWPATVVWACAFALVFALVAVAARRWRRWPSYLVGSLPLLVVLYLLFEHLDRLLPAG